MYTLPLIKSEQFEEGVYLLFPFLAPLDPHTVSNMQ